MVFLKRSITALLAFFIVFLTSIFTSEKTYAKENVLKPECLIAQFVIADEKHCYKPKTAVEELFPKVVLIKTIDKKKEDKKKENIIQPPAFQFQLTQSPASTLSADVLFDMINRHRTNINLSPYKKEEQVCSIAENRKNEITYEVFVTGNLHAGFWEDNHPFWAVENIIWQNSETDAMKWWLNSPIHRNAIEGNYEFACGVCNGNVCNMIFSSLTPKTTPKALFEKAKTSKLEI